MRRQTCAVGGVHLDSPVFLFHQYGRFRPASRCCSQPCATKSGASVVYGGIPSTCAAPAAARPRSGAALDATRQSSEGGSRRPPQSTVWRRRHPPGGVGRTHWVITAGLAAGARWPRSLRAWLLKSAYSAQDLNCFAGPLEYALQPAVQRY